MWCRTILTAVAISYIICMLLLSGLQKEDLDANTLEKLSRHNVNIDDMNNESRRHECLLNSYLASGNNTEVIVPTEDHETIGISTTSKSIENTTNNQEDPKLVTRMPKILVDKAVFQRKTKNNRTGLIMSEETKKDRKGKSNVVIDNSHNFENENNDLQIEYNIQDQPDLESVMNFWTKLTHYTEKVVIKAPTTSTSPYVSEEKSTNVTTVEVESFVNNGYVHSREMEYISRILAEYLASQATAATTQKVTTIKTHPNIMHGNTEDLLKAALHTKHIKQTLDYNDVKNFTQDNMQPREVLYINMTDQNKSTTSYDGKQPYRQTNRNSSSETMPVELNLFMKYNPIRFIDKLLHINNDLNFKDAPTHSNSSTTKSIRLLINKDDELQEKSETFERYNFLQFMKNAYINESKHLDQNQNVMNKNILKIAPIQLKQWKPITNHKVINRQFKVIPIDKNDRTSSDDYEIYNDKLWNNPNKTAPTPMQNTKPIQKMRTNRFDDIPTHKIESEENFNISINNDHFKLIPADVKIMNQKFIEKLQQHKNLKSSNNAIKVRSIELNKLDTFKNIGVSRDRKASINKFGRSQPTIDRNLFNTELSESFGIPATRYTLDRKRQAERNRISNMDTDQFNDEAIAIINNGLNAKGFKENHFNDMPSVEKKSERMQESIRNQMLNIESDKFHNEPLVIRRVELKSKGFSDNHFNTMPAVIKKIKRQQESEQSQMYNIKSDHFSGEPVDLQKNKQNSKESNFNHFNAMPAVRKKIERKHKFYQNQMTKIDNKASDETATIRTYGQIEKVSHANYLNAMPAVRKQLERKPESEQNQGPNIDSNQYNDETAPIRHFVPIKKASNDIEFNNMPALRKNLERKKQNQMSSIVIDQFNAEATAVRNVDNNSKEFNVMPALRKQKEREHKSYQYQMTKTESYQFDDNTATVRNFEQIEKASKDNYIHALPAVRKNVEEQSERNYMSNITTINNFEKISKESNENHFNSMPILANTKQGKQDPINQFKTQNKSLEANNGKVVVTSVSVKESKPNQNYDRNFNEQGIPANIINDIADKVKQIVLRDIEKELATTTDKSTSTTIKAFSTTTTVNATSSTTTTAFPTTITSTSIKAEASTTDKLSTLQKEITETNYVIQKLMEIFDEFKAMQDAKKSTTNVPRNTNTLNYDKISPTQLPKQIYKPPVEASFDPYLMKTLPVNMKSVELSPYGPSMVPVLMSSGVNLMHHHQSSQYVPQLNIQQNKEHRSSAITIQTNSNEIAPLAIQISNPVKVINQNIPFTTKGPTDKRKEHEHESNIDLDEKFGTVLIEHGYQNEKPHLQSDPTKKVRFSDIVKRYHEYSDGHSYKNTFYKDKEESLYKQDYGNSLHTETVNYPPRNPLDGRSHQRGINFQGRISRQDRIKHHMPSLGYIRQQPQYESPKFHEKLERIENWPRNRWKEFNGCCDEIPARQQMSLSKVKQRTRYDDTHFTNFLKSQQKVTDMLEKILANKMKPNSVETT